MIKSKTKNKKVKNKLLLKIVGIWENRKDMVDSVKWVNRLREKNRRKFDR